MVCLGALNQIGLDFNPAVVRHKRAIFQTVRLNKSIGNRFLIQQLLCQSYAHWKVINIRQSVSGKVGCGPFNAVLKIPKKRCKFLRSMVVTSTTLQIYVIILTRFLGIAHSPRCPYGHSWVTTVEIHVRMVTADKCRQA
jgi:hypothetical protein